MSKGKKLHIRLNNAEDILKYCLKDRSVFSTSSNVTFWREKSNYIGHTIPSEAPLTVNRPFLFQPGFSSKHLNVVKRLACLLQDDSKQASE